MEGPINLNKARKARAKADAQATAAENRVRFGQSKSARKLRQLDAIKTARDLDARKREP